MQEDDFQEDQSQEDDFQVHEEFHRNQYAAVYPRIALLQDFLAPDQMLFVGHAAFLKKMSSLAEALSKLFGWLENDALGEFVTEMSQSLHAAVTKYQEAQEACIDSYVYLKEVLQNSPKPQDQGVVDIKTLLVHKEIIFNADEKALDALVKYLSSLVGVVKSCQLMGLNLDAIVSTWEQGSSSGKGHSVGEHSKFHAAKYVVGEALLCLEKVGDQADALSEMAQFVGIYEGTISIDLEAFVNGQNNAWSTWELLGTRIEALVEWAGKKQSLLGPEHEAKKVTSIADGSSDSEDSDVIEIQLGNIKIADVDDVHDLYVKIYPGALKLKDRLNRDATLLDNGLKLMRVVQRLLNMVKQLAKMSSSFQAAGIQDLLVNASGNLDKAFVMCSDAHTSLSVALFDAPTLEKVKESGSSIILLKKHMKTTNEMVEEVAKALSTLSLSLVGLLKAMSSAAQHFQSLVQEWASAAAKYDEIILTKPMVDMYQTGLEVIDRAKEVYIFLWDEWIALDNVAIYVHPFGGKIAGNIKILQQELNFTESPKEWEQTRSKIATLMHQGHIKVDKMPKSMTQQDTAKDQDKGH